MSCRQQSTVVARAAGRLIQHDIINEPLDHLAHRCCDGGIIPGATQVDQHAPSAAASVHKATITAALPLSSSSSSTSSPW